MKEYDKELHYLTIEAHHVHKMIKQVQDKVKGDLIIIPNLSYGLVAVSPILELLRKNYYLSYSKVGSSGAHNNPTVFERNLFPLHKLFDSEDQPSIIVVDGTRNTGGRHPEQNKYPDSQQGYLNYTALVNDVIMDGGKPKYLDRMPISLDHIKKLRKNQNFTEQFRQMKPKKSYGKTLNTYHFGHWNPAGLKLSILNHGQNCKEEVESLNINNVDSDAPWVIFVNSVMPGTNHESELESKLGYHSPGYFDDTTYAQRKSVVYDNCGVYIGLSIAQDARKKYHELFGGENVSQ